MKIELKHVAKKFENATPLKDVNATINEGDIIPIIGPSGTGKTTLLRCINMLDPPTEGKIYIDGLEITKNKKNFERVRNKIGMVFQSYNLFGHLSAIENVMLAPMQIKKMSKQEAYDIAIEQLRTVGLAEKALKYPDELSGGQKQRVSIARTLAMSPQIILLDEPTSALDPTMVREVESVICRLAELGKTMMIVTHEMRLAKAIGNRVFYLDEGIVYEDGSPEQIFNNPRRERTKVFVNNLKVFKYKCRTDSFSYDEYRKKFSLFVENNDLDANTEKNLYKIIEDLAKIIIPYYVNDSIPLTILLEYDKDNLTSSLVLYYYSNNEDISNAIKQLMGNYSDNISIESISDDKFNKKATVIM